MRTDLYGKDDAGAVSITEARFVFTLDNITDAGPVKTPKKEE